MAEQTTEEKVDQIKQTWADNFDPKVQVIVSLEKEGVRVFEKKGSEKPQ